MALVSIAPLVSRSGVRKSFIKSTTYVSAFSKQRPTVAVVKTNKSAGPITMTLSSDTQRRAGNHHSNVWEDDVIHSLSTSYGAPVYRERAETLIKDIKLQFLSVMEGSSDDDLIKRLQIVDAMECLGIDRHFQPEIKRAMDHVYRYWNERGIGLGSKDSFSKDLYPTALGFRALRLHRYNVSSAVFDNFKDENGQFFCNSNGEEGKADILTYHAFDATAVFDNFKNENKQFFCNSNGEEGKGDKRVRSMLSLFRASNISFPGEKVMDEAKTFATEYLNKVLTGQTVTESLSREVKYALEFPWYCSVPRWEARNYIEIYDQNHSWLKSNINQKILELAKLDFNILQSMHHKELQLISRWWTESYLPQVAFYRKRHVELYFWVLTGIFEPEFSSSRISFTQISTIATVLDDLYDTYGTLDEIRIFTEGVRRWDISFVACLPDQIKKIFEFFMMTANELAAEVEKTQGRDMQAYIRKNGWERYLVSYLQEAEWMASGHVPSFDEYFKNGLTSSGMCILNLIPLLLVGQILPEDVLEQIYYPSQFHHFLELTIRLKDDLTDFELEKERGEIVSSLECYLRDNPKCTWEDALNHMKGILDHSISELNWEFLKEDNVPLSCKKLTFNLARGLHFLFHHKDGISITDQEIKDQIFKVLIKPVPL